MAEIDVNLYKQDEKMRTYCEKKEKRIESKQISTEINPPKPPKPPKQPKKKEVDPIQFMKYANAHKREINEEFHARLQYEKEQQKQIMKQMKLERYTKKIKDKMLLKTLSKKRK